MNGWTPDRKAKQSNAIQRWRPWEHSTGPRTLEGKAKVTANVTKWREANEALRSLAQAFHQAGDEPATIRGAQ